jgi:hypothetical protein
MKVHVVLEGGKIVGVGPAISPSEPGTPGQFRGGLRAGPNQKLQEVDVPEDFLHNINPEDLHQKLSARLKK